MLVLTLQVFLADATGAKFSDITTRHPVLFQQCLDFFNVPAHRQRLVDSERDHGRPALAGVIRALEHQPWFDAFMRNNDGHDTYRLRQAIGVIVRMVMEDQGYQTTGSKGSLGTRAKVPTGTTTPGAYRNSSGLSLWFTRAERYERNGGPEY